MASEDIRIEHVTRNAFFGYLGVLVTIFLAVNVGVITYLGAELRNVESRSIQARGVLDSKIDKIADENNQLSTLLTEVRLSLRAIETRLGISEQEKYRYIQQAEPIQTQSLIEN